MHDHCSHGHVHEHEIHNFSNKKRFSFVIILNLIITVVEYIGGILSGSLALISDAGHNLSDVLALILGYAGERVADIKPGRKFSFGLKRFEVLIAMINALTLVIIGIYIVYEAVQRYLSPQKVDPGIMIPVAVVGLLGNAFSILILNRGRDSSLNVRAAFLHLLYDAISSVAVIITGVILYFHPYYILDLAISLLIVIMIVWSSLDIIKESLRIFLQGTPRGIDSDEVYNSILSLENVKSLHGLHIWSVNSNEVFLSCHICLDTSGGADSDRVINDVNRHLEQKYGIIHTTIQIENRNLCELNGGNCCR